MSVFFNNDLCERVVDWKKLDLIKLRSEYPYVIDDVFTEDYFFVGNDRIMDWEDAMIWAISKGEINGKDIATNLGRIFYFMNLTDAVEFKLKFSK